MHAERRTDLVQVDERLLQPTAQQARALCGLALVQQAQQCAVLHRRVLAAHQSTYASRCEKSVGLTPSPVSPSARSALASSFMYCERSCVRKVYALWFDGSERSERYASSALSAEEAGAVGDEISAAGAEVSVTAFVDNNVCWVRTDGRRRVHGSGRRDEQAR